MKLIEAGKALIKKFESCVLKAYIDAVGILTIGWGHTGKDVVPGLIWSQSQADQAFEDDTTSRSKVLAIYLDKVPTSDQQFSAMLSLMYNIGNNALLNSTVLRLHKAGDYKGAADAFLMWNKGTVDGKKVVLNGLTARRKEEKALYLS